MRQIRCPECDMKLPVMLPEVMTPKPVFAFVWCRSKTCKGKWLPVTIGVPALVG